LPWFRLDDSFHSHPKVIAAGNEAIGLYVRCGTHAAEHLTDGAVSQSVALSYGSRALADTLVRCGLWHRARGGWLIHDYLDYNPSREAVEKERKASAERQRRRREAMASRRDTAVTTTVSTSAPTRTSYGSTNGRARDPANAARSPSKPKPPWCGMCDQTTRLTNGDNPTRCLNCHPLIERY
jgi:hypothetical protein